MKCFIFVGDVSKEMFIFAGAVSKAILRGGGMYILDECKKIGKTNKHGIAVTSAGNLPSKYIIHLEAGHKSWKEMVFSALKEAESKMFTSVAMPALGTGNYGFMVVYLTILSLWQWLTWGD